METPKNLQLEASEWSVNGRITLSLFARRFLTALMWFAISVYCSALIFELYGLGADILSSQDLLHLHYALGALFVFYIAIQGAKRIQDAGHSGLLILAPLYNLKLLFDQTMNGNNKYGARPTPQSEAITPVWKKFPLALLFRFKNLINLILICCIADYYLNTFKAGTHIYVINNRNTSIDIIIGYKEKGNYQLNGFNALNPKESKIFYVPNSKEYFLGINDLSPKIGSNFPEETIEVCNNNGKIKIKNGDSEPCNSQKIRLLTLPTSKKKISLK